MFIKTIKHFGLVCNFPLFFTMHGGSSKPLLLFSDNNLIIFQNVDGLFRLFNVWERKWSVLAFVILTVHALRSCQETSPSEFCLDFLAGFSCSIYAELVSLVWTKHCCGLSLYFFSGVCLLIILLKPSWKKSQAWSTSAIKLIFSQSK